MGTVDISTAGVVAAVYPTLPAKKSWLEDTDVICSQGEPNVSSVPRPLGNTEALFCGGGFLEGCRGGGGEMGGGGRA